MAKGDGRGGNQTRPGGRPSVELSPVDILYSRLELHRACADGKEQSSEPKEYHAEMASKVWAQILDLTDGTRWKLEALEGGARLLEAMGEQRRTEGDPRELAVAQLDVCERTLNTLDEHGVIWVRQLVEWTEPMILQTKNSGEVTVREIRKALADVGLKLREPRQGEDPRPPKPVSPRVPKRTTSKRYVPYKPKVVDENRRARTVIGLLAEGVQIKDINRRVGLSEQNYSTVGDLRKTICRRVSNGECPCAIAKSFGFVFGKARAKAVTYIESLKR